MTPSSIGPLTGDESALWQAASRVLDANWTGSATVPSPGLYPHQWSWDSAFTCLGLARCRRERAETELLTLFEGQWANGLLPHIVFSAAVPRYGYFPGPELWRSRSHPAAPRRMETSGITQPPLHAMAALRLHRAARTAEESARSKAFLGVLYPLLARQHAFLARERDLDGSGLIAVCHPWESGLDNSPAWDRPLAALRLPASAYAPRHVPRGLPTGADYERYVWLAATLRDSGYRAAYLRDAHPFAVEDPLVNAIYLASTHALAEIAAIVGADALVHAEQAVRIHQALQTRLWDPQSCCFRPWDLRARRSIPAVTIASFGPLLDPQLPAAQVRSLSDLLLSARFAGAAGYPVPTCDIQSATFDRAAFWRGPTWINTNWLLWYGAAQHGLAVIADLLAGASLRLVRQSGFREFFDPFDGTGRGSHEFSWTAALIIDLLADRRAAPDAA
jgi:glycogen debranching enzyme